MEKEKTSLKISRVHGGMKTRFLLNDIRFCRNEGAEVKLFPVMAFVQVALTSLPVSRLFVLEEF